MRSYQSALVFGLIIVLLILLADFFPKSARNAESGQFLRASGQNSLCR